MLLGLFALIGVLIFVNIRFVKTSPLWSELLTPWNAANQWLKAGKDPYSEAVRLHAQELLYNRPAVIDSGEHGCQLALPLPSLLLLLPFGLLPYELARALIMSVIEICLVLSVIVGVFFAEWKPRWPLFVMLAGFSVLWFPGIQAIVSANPRVLSLFLQLLSLLFLKQHRDLAAGLLAGLALAGLGAVLPLLVYLSIWTIKEKRFNFLFGWLAAAAVMTGLSLLIQPQWTSVWLREVLRWLSEEKGFTPVSTDLGFLNPYPFSITFSIGLAAFVLVYLFSEWKLSMGKGETWFQWTAVMTLLLSQFLTFFPTTSSHLLLLPVLSLVFAAGAARWGRSAHWFTAVLLLMLLAGSWGLFYLGGNVEESFMLFYGPVILLAAAMMWIRWWKIRGGLSLPMDYVQIPEE
ncbi:MAG: hypothetical protein JXA25_03570 [Anaerolineales bacterium]|nr:hypothetical protein [Anaerolineales bacterium]